MFLVGLKMPQLFLVPFFTISGLQRYLETSKTSKMEPSVKIAAFGVNHFCKKLHLRCLAGF